MISVQSLSELDQAAVDAQIELLAAMVQEAEPDLRVASGFFRDVVLRLAGMLAAANQENINLVRRSNSLRELQTDPDLADDDLVDRVASNYLTTRKEGAAAAGSIAVVVSTAPFVVPATAVFTTAGGLSYVPAAGYTGQASSVSVTGATDVLMTARSGGGYEMVFPALAADVGTVYNATAGASLTPSGVVGVTSARLATAMTGGTDRETTAALIARLQAGVANRSLATEASVEGVLRDAVPGLLAASVVGYGDPEQLRYHALFPVAFGGRVDVYARTSDVPDTVTVTKTCVYVGTDSTGYGVWQAALGRDDAPGFYEASGASRPGYTDGFVVTSDTRAYDVTAEDAAVGTPGTVRVPDVATAKEAAYTRYQTATLRFRDTVTSTAGLTANVSTADYTIDLVCPPALAAAQDAVADRAVASPAGDCLVRAPVPCFVGVSLSLTNPAGAPAVDAARVKAAAAARVNASGFTRTLTAFELARAVQDELTAQGALAAVTGVSLTGRVRKPDGATAWLSGSTQLTVVEDAGNMVTSRTVCFFCSADSVAVTLTTV